MSSGLCHKSIRVRVSGFSQTWTTYPVQVEIPSFPIFGDLRGRVEPDFNVVIRQILGTGLGPELPHRARFSSDGKWLEIAWDSKGNASEYLIEIEDSPPGASRYSRVSIGTGDAILTGVPWKIGDLHLGLKSQPQVIQNDDGIDDLICTTTGFQGGMFLCRRLFDRKGFIFSEPKRIFLPYLNHDTVDFDGDGKVDLVCVEGQRLLLLVNHGTNTHPVFQEEGYLRTQESVLEIKDLAKVDVVDWDGDGLKDILAGTSDNSEYWPKGKNPWENRDCGIGIGQSYSRTGRWLGGREHSSIVFCKNIGTKDRAVFEEPVFLLADGSKVDLEGGGKVAAGSLKANGLIDIVFGEHLDKIFYFKNVGSRGRPKLRRGKPLRQVDGRLLRNPQCMSEPIVWDLDLDGVGDIVFGSEDGYVYFCRGHVREGGMPRFEAPERLKQLNPRLGTGVLAVPSAVDWDDDGDLDLIVGSAAGYVEYFENIGTRKEPRFSLPVRLEAGGKTIRIQAGYRGSIQGPHEAKWGYTAPVVCDWDGDGLKDILLSDIKGEHLFYRNVGKVGDPVLAEPRPITVGGKPLRTVWRTRPIAEDLNGDGLADYVCLDREGYLSIHWRRRTSGRLVLEEGVRPTFIDGSPIKMDGLGGNAGRTQLCAADWDGDGDWDIIFGAHEGTPMLGKDGRTTVLLLENVGTAEEPIFKRPVPVLLNNGRVMNLGGHCCSPHAVDWDGDGQLDLIVGAENGNIYYFHRSLLVDNGKVEVSLTSEADQESG